MIEKEVAQEIVKIINEEKLSANDLENLAFIIDEEIWRRTGKARLGYPKIRVVDIAEPGFYIIPDNTSLFNDDKQHFTVLEYEITYAEDEPDEEIFWVIGTREEYTRERIVYKSAYAYGPIPLPPQEDIDGGEE